MTDARELARAREALTKIGGGRLDRQIADKGTVHIDLTALDNEGDVPRGPGASAGDDRKSISQERDMRGPV